MYTITFTLEREGTNVFVFASIDGFYLWATDVEMVLRSIVPLVQHLYWRNHHICIAPNEEPDFTILLTVNTMMINFKSVSRLQSPEILVKGKWWTGPTQKMFYVPSAPDNMIPEKIYTRIIGSINT